MTLAAAPSRIDPEVIADQLLEARARTLLLVAPLSDEDLHAPARSADEPDPLGPGPHRALRGALAHPQPRRADRVRRDAGAVQPVRAPAQHAGRAGAAGPRRVPRDHGRDPRPGARPPGRRRLRRRQSAAPRRLRLPAWCCSTSTSTTRPSCRRCSSSRARPTAPLARLDARRGAAPAPPAAGEMVRFPGGAVEIGTDDRSAAYDNERPGARGRAGAVLDRRASGHQPGLPGLHRAPAGTRRREYWSEAGWRWRDGVRR